jgi:hypothetical protein
MISVFWMTVTALGFMLAGVLLWEWEWKVGGILFCGTWLWMMFPKAIDWSCKMLGRLFMRKRPEVKTG